MRRAPDIQRRKQVLCLDSLDGVQFHLLIFQGLPVEVLRLHLVAIRADVVIQS